MSELNEQQREALRRDLVALREQLGELLLRSADAAQPVDAGEPIGRVSRMDAIQQQKMDAANRSAALARKNLVEAALARFEADEYGDCLDCGEAIDVRRLEARPESAFCIRCQSARERR